MTEEHYDLPPGWTSASLGCISRILGGGTPERSRAEFYRGGTVSWATPTDIHAERILAIRETSTRITELGLRKSSAQLLPAGTVLFSSRASIGKIAIAATPMATNQGFANLTPLEGLDSKYLAYCLKRFTKEIRGLASGTTYLEVSKAALRQFAVPISPSAEQRRIVAKIEALFEQSRTARDALDRIPALLKRFRQSVLAAAFGGDLTRDWRDQNPALEPVQLLIKRARGARLPAIGEEREKRKGNRHLVPNKPENLEPLDAQILGMPELPAAWAWVTVEFLASRELRSIQSGPFGSNLHHSEFRDTGVLAIGIDNVLDGAFSTGKQHRISREKYEQLKKYSARPLDVLITVMATVGRCCVAPRDLEPAIITKHVYRISVDQELCEPAYLMNALRGCRAVRAQLYGEIQGVTRPGVNGQILRRLVVPLAPLEEQRMILSTLEDLMRWAGAIEEAVQSVRRRAGTLEQSVLGRAFRGELVPQDATDEPASILLDRIQTCCGTTAFTGSVQPSPRRGKKGERWKALPNP